MIHPTIPPQACLHCTKPSGTKIIYDGCLPSLSKSQRLRFDHTYQLLVVELFNCECVDCGHSAEATSGELCADHLQTKGSDPTLRYDLANAVCRCLPCHNKRGTGEIAKVPPKEKLPKETVLKQEKVKKLPVCKVAGCPIFALGTGKKAQFCFKHQ